jgi:hypothetical protein
VFLEFGLVIEEILLGRRSTLEQVDHALGLRDGIGAVRRDELAIKHGGEGGDADPRSRFSEEMTSVHQELGLAEGVGHRICAVGVFFTDLSKRRFQVFWLSLVRTMTGIVWL